MNRLISIVLGLALLAGLIFWVTKPKIKKEPLPAEIKAEGSAQALQQVPKFASDVLYHLSEETVKLAERVTPAIVSVSVERDKAMIEQNAFLRGLLGTNPSAYSSIGSGVIVSRDGYIVTNYHVIAAAERIRVRLDQGRVEIAQLVGVDTLTDLAVLKVEAEHLVPVEWGDSSKVRLGEYVINIGNPYNLNRSITTDVVSGLGRQHLVNDGLFYEDFLQLDSAVDPGNSGGATVNIRGEFVGLMTAGLLGSDGQTRVGFAIPSNLVRFVLDSIQKSGHVVRGYLGVRVQELDSDLAEAFGLDNLDGALVGDIIPGSPADESGLQGGDVIVRVGDYRVSSAMQLRLLVSQMRVGGTIEIEFMRDGKILKVQVALAQNNLAGQEGLEEDLSPKPVESGPSEMLEGFRAEKIQDALRKRFHLDEAEEGVVITAVKSPSTASLAGLKEGMVVLELNRVPVETIESFSSALAEARKSPRILLLVRSGSGKKYVILKSE